MTELYVGIVGELLLGVLVVSCLCIHHEVLAACQRHRATRSSKRR